MSTDVNYLYFDVYDYTQTVSVSSYTLSITPLSFIPRFDTYEGIVSRSEVLWDFGDGTITRNFSASHVYTLPGVYNVSCYFLTTSGNGHKDTYIQTVYIQDYYSDALALSSNSLGVDINTNFSIPILVSRINSWQTYDINSGYDILLYAENVNASLIDIDAYNKDKYAHLKPYSGFKSYELNTYTDRYELYPVRQIQTVNNVELYVHNYYGTITPCRQSDSGSILAGTSGQKVIYYSDDIPANASNEYTVAVAYFNTKQFDDLDTQIHNYEKSSYPTLKHVNPAKCSIDFINYQVPHHLSITSNGIDSEGTNIITSFDIAPEKYTGQIIPFIVKLKDTNNYSIRSAYNLNYINSNEPLVSNGVHVYAVNSNNDLVSGVQVVTNFGVLSSQELGGYFRGYLLSDTEYTGLRIYAETVANCVSAVSGYSSEFSIYNKGAYSIGRVNENFNAKAQTESYVFQEQFQDYTAAVSNFLGTIVGDISSSPNTLGKHTYERIANFVDNISYIDTCGIDALRSIHDMMDEQFFIFNSYNFNYPASLSRLLEIFSIKFSKLKGGRNVYNTYFDTKGYVNANVVYGKNLGKELDFFTTTLTAGPLNQSIVAYEKFGEIYTLLNTDLLSSNKIEYIDPFLKVYPLSGYNENWGWGLVLPAEYSTQDIPKYYSFYEYVPALDNTWLEGVINWNDINTTRSLSAISNLNQWDEVRHSMIAYSLKQGLGLVPRGD